MGILGKLFGTDIAIKEGMVRDTFDGASLTICLIAVMS